jgi:hypothetical protein
MNLKQVTATIAISQSLSAAVDCGLARHPSQIDIPSGWTEAEITFQVSKDGSTFLNLMNEDGEYIVPETSIGAGGVAIGLDQKLMRGNRFFKVRSGTSGSVVVQTAARTLTVHVQLDREV